MPWEGFLQVIKRLFEMTNYKNAPYAVASYWSMKTALRLISPGVKSATWFDEVAHASSNEVLCDLSAASKASPLVLLLHDSMAGLHSVQHLASFQRDSVEVRLGDFILASVQGQDGLIVGLVAEMVQAFCFEASFIRIRFTDARLVGKVDLDRGGVFTVFQSQPCIECAPVCVESSAMCELHAWLEDGCYTFTY